MKSIILSFMFLWTISFVPQQPKTKDEAYAALIFSVAKYISWEKVNGDFEIVVLNQPKLANQLRLYYATRKINDAKVIVYAATGKKITFIGAEMVVTENDNISAENCLSINLNAKNAILNFVEEGDKIKIKMNKTLAEKSKLKIANQLLSIVDVIE